MSETWHPTNGEGDPTPGGTGTTGSGTTAPPPPGRAIALPPADSNQGALIPPAEFPPTGPNPPTGPGPQTPPAGVWTAPPGSGWVPGAPGMTPPAGYWPPPPGYWPPPAHPSSSKRRPGVVAAIAAVVLVVAVLGGAGLGHAVWPVQNTPIASGSGSSASAGSSGGATSPFGGGGSSGEQSPFGGGASSGQQSPFGSGSTGNSSTGAGGPSDISAIASKVDPGLVDINTNLSYQSEQAAGTGMVLTSSGEILTNNHVIDGATSISVTDVGNGKTYTGKVVGYDRTGDVAVVQLSGASGLQTVSTGGSASVGEAVVGVGNAGGTGGTPSTAGGSVVALDQSITASDDSGGNSESLSGLIEVNAGIEPGDSGGSLVNTSGQVIGMDTAASTGSGYDGSGTQAYAIPISTALSLANQIKAGKASTTVHIGTTGFLGVSVEDSDSAGGSGSFGGGSGSGGFGGGLGDGSGGTSGSGNSATSGAAVESTLSGSPSDQAGLVQGDVITGLNGHAVTSATDLSNLLEPEHPGDTVQLQWTDTSGQTQTASVKLASGPPA
jgi:S1-C subfamily serine protease